MKKLILGLVAALATFAAQAGNWTSTSFFAGGISAIYVTNTICPTNLLTASTVGTNWDGLTFTNMGTRVTVATNSGLATWKADSLNPFVSYVPLWSLTDGSWPMYNNGSNGISGTFTTLPSYANIAVRAVGGSGANAAVTFVVTPVSGTGAAIEGIAGDEWSFGVTATTTTPVNLITNVPLYRWPGVAGLRLRRIVNADTDASSQVIVTECSLNGYRP